MKGLRFLIAGSTKKLAILLNFGTRVYACAYYEGRL